MLAPKVIHGKHEIYVVKDERLPLTRSVRGIEAGWYEWHKIYVDFGDLVGERCVAAVYALGAEAQAKFALQALLGYSVDFGSVSSATLGVRIVHYSIPVDVHNLQDHKYSKARDPQEVCRYTEVFYDTVHMVRRWVKNE